MNAKKAVRACVNDGHTAHSKVVGCAVDRAPSASVNEISRQATKAINSLTTLSGARRRRKRRR